MKLKKSEPAGASKPPILLLDSNPAFLKLLKLILSDQYQVASFTDPLSATLWLEEGNHPVLIISDAGAPTATGSLVSSHLFLKNLRNSGFFRNTPHILLSASDGLEDIANRLSLKVDAVFRKPFNPVKLKEVIAAILNPEPEYATA